jgi:FkbM family methyltransferase
MTWNDQFRSQHLEDSWICNHWTELKLPEFGYFVEFGAGDGEHLSNTYWLETSRGWHGMLIEPNPDNKILGRPGSAIERCAVGPRGRMKLGCCDDPYLSGRLRDAKAPDERVRAKKFIDVEVYPLDEILDRYGVEGVNLISIDTEGTELEAWRTLDLRRRRPEVAIIELLTWGLPDTSAEIIAQLESDGYRMAERTYHNGIFVDTRR